VRFTIERIRTAVLVAGVVLVVALGIVLARGRWKNPFKYRDIPKRLGADIQQQADGFTYTQSHGGHTLFKIHASRVVQLKNDHAMLHDVIIELYGDDGSRLDRIAGAEFEYDQKSQIATAAGPVEITMTRPTASPTTPAPKLADHAPIHRDESPDHILVKTNGLRFDQKTGVATTDQRVDFAVTQGSGNAIGAAYDSSAGHLVLDRQVELNVQRNGETVNVRAQHAEFDRGDMLCRLTSAIADYHKGQAVMGIANILFRDDGSAVRLDASNGVALTSATGGHLTAPTGWLEFNQKNQPQRGHLEGGVKLDETTQTATGSRESHGAAPNAELAFSPDGELRHAHLERNVELSTIERSAGASGPVTESRTWHSPVADIDFRDAGNAQAELESMHGIGGVVITGESRRGNGPVLPSRLSADDVRLDFAPHSSLNAFHGVGHAGLEQTAASGNVQTGSADRLEVRFLPQAARSHAPSAPATSRDKPSTASAATSQQIESATLESNVILTQQPAARPGATPTAPMRATAGRADYEGSGEWTHLTIHPRVDDGGMQMTADKIDISQASGDAFAHGNVKATWFGNAEPRSSPGRATSPSAAAFGGQGPSHVIAEEARLQHSTGEATFRGNARLWQDANSVAAPIIVLNRQRQTLTATSSDSHAPVAVVLVGAEPSERAGTPESPVSAKPSHAGAPSVIRMQGGALHYSAAERKAILAAAPAASVVTETATAKTFSDEVDLALLPPGNHAGKNGSEAQVDKVTARGHVIVTANGRRGTGTELVYTGETGQYVLTGTAAEPPKMTDIARGVVTGDALIFSSRDDSVSIEGSGAKTVTETRTPK